MQRSSHGSRLLAFQRAHRISDSRSLSAASPAAPARHAPRGARPPRRRNVGADVAWTFLLALTTALLFTGACILCAGVSDFSTPSALAAPEASR